MQHNRQGGGRKGKILNESHNQASRADFGKDFDFSGVIYYGTN